MSPDRRPSGLPHALSAYVMWGLFPLWLMPIRHVPAWEAIGWRIVFTLPFCAVLLLVQRQTDAVRAVLADRRAVLALAAGAVLIGGNWLIYFAAINGGHVLAASLGYYINPLANVLAGALFLKERLSRRAWAAVGLAAFGVSLLAWDALDTLFISLSLAITFCAYRLLRKLAPVPAAAGMTVETTVLLIPAWARLVWKAGHGGLYLGESALTTAILVGNGVVMTTPLILFAIAAPRMDYSTLGFIQFLAPTINFVLALFVFAEPLRPMQLACFVAIWAAIGLFVWDIAGRRVRALRDR